MTRGGRGDPFLSLETGFEPTFAGYDGRVTGLSAAGFRVDQGSRIGPGASWLVSFADLLAILLAIFILIHSVQTDEVSAGGDNGGETGPRTAEPPGPVLRLDYGTDTDYLSSLLGNALDDLGLADRVELVVLSREVLIRAPLDVWTDGVGPDLRLPGRAVRPMAETPLGALAGFLGRLSNRVDLRIHPRTGLRGGRLPAQAREETLKRGLRAADLMMSAGLAHPPGVVIASGGEGEALKWVLDVVVDRHGRE